MLRFALKLAALPALALAAMPAQSAVILAGGLAAEPLANPFQLKDADRSLGSIKGSVTAPQLFLSLDGAVPARPPIAIVAAIVPEPVSWAMMVVGLTVIGGAIRLVHRRGRHTISFV